MKAYNDRRIFASFLVVLFLSIVLGSCRNGGSEAYDRLKRDYASAWEAQCAGDFNKAEAGFRSCIDSCLSPSHAADDSIRNMLPLAMVQLMNVFQSQGKPDVSVAYFDSLKTLAGTSGLDGVPKHGGKSKVVLTKYFKRDVYVLLAYSMSRTDDEEEAARLMDEALAMPLYNPTHERLFRDYAYAAVVYFCVPSCQEKVFKYGLKALDETKLCERKSGAQWLVTMLGSMYHRCGKADKAISMYEEGYEIAAMDRDTLGMANAKKEIADYLLQWGIDTLADRYASEAVNYLECVSNTNPMVTTTVLAVKAKSLVANGRHDEAMKFLSKARNASKGLPYNSGPSDVDVLMGTALVNSGNLQQEQEGVKILKRAANGATSKLRGLAWFELGATYISHGKTDAGEMALDSMYYYANNSGSPLLFSDAFHYALDYYMRCDDIAKTGLYGEACRKIDTEQDYAATIKSIVGALTKLEMDSKQSAAAISGRTYMWYKLLGGVLVAVVVGIGVWFVYNRNQYRRRHSLAECRLSSAREQLSSVREELSTTQADLRKVAEENEEMNQKLAQIEDREAVSVRDGVALKDVLRSKGDAKFKEYFCRAYPYFLKTLREESTHITRKEELYCMLIALGQTNAELAQLFSVERSSVTIAKYRLRKKIKLADGETLEEKLEGIISPKSAKS